MCSCGTNNTPCLYCLWKNVAGHQQAEKEAKYNDLYNQTAKLSESNPKLQKTVEALRAHIAQQSTNHHNDMLKMQKENHILKEKLVVVEKYYEQLLLTNKSTLQSFDTTLHNATHSLKADLKDEKHITEMLTRDIDELRAAHQEVLRINSRIGEAHSKLRDENESLRSTIATIGSIVKVAEQL